MSVWQNIHRAWKQAWCRHQWNQVGTDRFAITQAKGSIAGEVTLTYYECQKCGKDMLIPSDRTYTLKDKG